MPVRNPTGAGIPLPRNNKRGFSLVELSIVLIIIGLLVGGIMAGRSLIHTAELQGVVSEMETYQSATRAFQDMYGGFPGDLPNATEIWGALDGGDGLGSDCTSLAATDKRTCNGDGNYMITGTTQNEYFRFWQHLANAELIPGLYTGAAGPENEAHHIPGENCPLSTYSSNVGWSIPHFKDYAGDSTLWARTEVLGHTLTVGGATDNFTWAPVFTVVDASGIDKKIDDGMPGLGMVQILYWPECSTATAATEYDTAKYQLDNDRNNQCALIFPEVINP